MIYSGINAYYREFRKIENSKNVTLMSHFERNLWIIYTNSLVSLLPRNAFLGCSFHLKMYNICRILYFTPKNDISLRAIKKEKEND